MGLPLAEYGSSYFKLDLDTLQSTRHSSFGSQPMKKVGCGFVCVNERTLCCFGGEGIEGTTQPGATFTKTEWSDEIGQTNEFHFFDTQIGRTNEFHFFDTQNGNIYVRTFAVYTLIGYLATGGRSPTLTHIENHVHFHINQCYRMM